MRYKPKIGAFQYKALVAAARKAAAVVGEARWLPPLLRRVARARADRHDPAADDKNKLN